MISNRDSLYDRPNPYPLCATTGSETIFSHARLANINRTYADRESMTKLNTDLCRKCGMLYRKPMIQDDQMRRYYRHQYVETFTHEPAGGSTQSKYPHEMAFAILKAGLCFMSEDSCLYVHTTNEAPNILIDMKKRMSLVHVLYFIPRTVQIVFGMAGLRDC